VEPEHVLLRLPLGWGAVFRERSIHPSSLGALRSCRRNWTQAKRVFRAAGLTDAEGRWVAGNTVAVQVWWWGVNGYMQMHVSPWAKRVWVLACSVRQEQDKPPITPSVTCPLFVV
jgi:hypothetical protein